MTLRIVSVIPLKTFRESIFLFPDAEANDCIVDSHSLCTTEFIGSRTAYEWLCDALDVYKPQQSEYGRLNLEGTVMSKRKLLKLVKNNHVSGWDDPRYVIYFALDHPDPVLTW